MAAVSAGTPTVTVRLSDVLRALLELAQPVVRALALLLALGRHLRAYAAEYLTALSFVSGWALVTSFIAALTSPLAWRLSVGLFLLSLCGWRLLWTLTRDGLYALSLVRKRRA